MDTQDKLYKRFIVIGYGYWGAGETIPAAKDALKRAGGSLRGDLHTIRFESDLPFAPPDRDATKAEADCWVGKNGDIVWQQCERYGLDAAATKNP